MPGRLSREKHLPRASDQPKFAILRDFRFLERISAILAIFILHGFSRRGRKFDHLGANILAEGVSSMGQEWPEGGRS